MGWWKIEGTQNVIGDGPLDMLGAAAGEIVAAHEAAFRHRPTKEEWEAFVAIDPGCARALLVEAPRIGVEVSKPEIFVDLAARSLDRLRPLEDPGPVRYHDPCQLGRGLGRYDEPRAILARLTGVAPEGFLRERAQGECSGGGGLLPATRPESSRAIADARIAEHRERGGGTLVTACASSLHRFRTRGERAEDLVSMIARAIP